jgi:two-component system, chemotaxis family, response regulator Rcp1
MTIEGTGPTSNSFPRLEPMKEVLLVEDCAADVEFTREGFRELGPTTRLHVVHDGAKAMDFLRRRGTFGAAPRPDMILLDLNLPGMSGQELLEQIKLAPELRSIPVVVLSSSRCPADVATSYDRHANCYIIKPPDLEGYVSIIRSIEAFWLRAVALPGERAVHEGGN